MGDKGEGGVKNLKKIDDIIYGWPKWYIYSLSICVKKFKMICAWDQKKTKVLYTIFIFLQIFYDALPFS